MFSKLRSNRIIRKILFLLGFRIEDKAPADYHPSVSVLIPAYNEEKWIAGTIKSVLRQSYPVDKIIVVDDCSTDKTGEIAAQFDEVTVLRTPKQSGMKAKAQKHGLQSVTTDLLVMLDADTVLDDKAVENIVPAMYDKKTFSACGYVIPQKITSIWESVRLIENLYGIGFFKKTQNYWGVLFVVSGCFSIYKTELLKSLKVQEHSIAEDLDLTFKAQLAQFRTKLVGSAICYPKSPDNWNTYKNQVRRWYRGFFQCLKKYWKDFWSQNKKLLFLVIITLFSNYIWIAFIFTLAVMTLQNNAGDFLYNSIYYFLFFDFLLIFVVVLLGSIKHKRIKAVLIGLPFYWFFILINNYLFIESGYLELIKKNKLEIWHKGH